MTVNQCCIPTSLKASQVGNIYNFHHLTNSDQRSESSLTTADFFKEGTNNDWTMTMQIRRMVGDLCQREKSCYNYVYFQKIL